MFYDELIEGISEEGITDAVRLERIHKLQDYIKAQSLLYDDHGSAVIGGRESPPSYPKSD